MQGGIGFDREQLVHRDAAEFGDAADVVAQQIDDHQVLGALLVAGAQVRARGGIGGGCIAARGGAFHWLGNNAAIASDGEEQLRRKTENLPLAIIDVSTIAGSRACAQLRVQRQRIADERGMRTETQVGLIDVARFDERVHPAKACA